MAVAFWLAADRDEGAGLIPDRPGPPAAPRWLRDCASLAWRLEQSNLAWWAFGYLVLFWVCGAAGVGIGSLFGGSKGLRKEFTQLGGQSGIVDAYLSALMLPAGLVAAGYAVSVVLRLRSAETGGLAEPVLVTGASRTRWALSQLLMAVLGSAVLLVVAGVFTGIGRARPGGVHRPVRSDADAVLIGRWTSRRLPTRRTFPAAASRRRHSGGCSSSSPLPPPSA